MWRFILAEERNEVVKKQCAKFHSQILYWTIDKEEDKEAPPPSHTETLTQFSCFLMVNKLCY